MKIAAQHPAPRSDSTLDTHLDPEQAEAFAHRLDCGMSLSEAADYLLEEHGLKLSRPSISRWVARRRRGKSETTFARFTEAVKTATAPGMDPSAAAALEKEGLDGAVEINALMLNRLIYAAGTSGDAYGMMHAAKVFAHLLGASAKARRADTSRMTAETARMKFEFSAAKAALQHAEALHKISKECQEDEDAKMVRAIARMFGRRPTPSKIPLSEWEQRIENAAIEIEAEEAKAKAEGGGNAEGRGNAEGKRQNAEVRREEEPERGFGDGAECRARAAEMERERIAEQERERIAEEERLNATTAAAVASAEASADGEPAAEPAVEPAGSSVEALPEGAAVASSVAGDDGKQSKTSRWFDPGLTQSEREMAAREERQTEKLRRREQLQPLPKAEEPDEIDAMLDGRKWWRPKFH